MGRTNPTYRDFLTDYEHRWNEYRRALRHEASEDFDRLFERARNYADAAGYANDPDREVLVMVSMLLAHEAELRRLRNRVESLDGNTTEDEQTGDQSG